MDHTESPEGAETSPMDLPVHDGEGRDSATSAANHRDNVGPAVAEQATDGHAGGDVEVTDVAVSDLPPGAGADQVDAPAAAVSSSSPAVEPAGASSEPEPNLLVDWPAGPVPLPVVNPVAADRQRSGSGRFWVPLLSGVLGGALVLAGVALAGGLQFGEESTSTTTTAAVTATAVETSSGSAATLQLTTAAGVDAVAVGEKVIPSIVTVQVGQETGSGFREFGSGSGVVLDTQGHIVTNNHVAEGNGSFRVVFADGRSYSADLVGADPLTDLAVLEISADGLVPISIGSTEDLQVGNPAVAVGNPLGLEGGPSLTVGVLSAFDRQVQTSASVILYGMLQTDAPITQGSSGGALVDDQGRLIGITTAVGVSSIGVEGVGFATPVEIVERVTRDIIATGSAHNAFLGIRGTTGFDRAADGADTPSGVLVDSVESGGAAGAAGVQAGDLIVSFDGHELQTMQDLVVLLRKAQVGDRVPVQVDRDGTVLDLEVTLGEG